MMFSGEYEHRADSQGRISMPARFRGSFKEGIILTRGYDRCIVAFTPSEWAKWEERMANLPMAQDKARKMIRLTFSGSFSLEMDRQGRVAIPSPLREYAQAGDEVVVVGAGRYVEIWAKELWVQERAMLDQMAWQIAEKMEDRG